MTNQALTGLFAVTNVTSRQVIWAGVAADKTWASKLASEALGRKPSASWSVSLAADLPDGGTEALAVAQGVVDGRTAVDVLLAEAGKDAVIKADRSSKDDWDDRAQAVDAAGIAGIAKGSKGAYYRAFAAAAHARAAAIEDGAE